MKKRVALVVILILIVLYIIPIQSGIELADGDGKHIHFFPWDADRVKIGWRHSVELTPWEETYDVTEDRWLSLSSTLYQAYGAGTPDTEGDVEFLSDGYIRVTGIDRVMPALSLFYVPISKYYLKDKNTKYRLEEYVPPYTDISISYRSINVYEWVYFKAAAYFT